MATANGYITITKAGSTKRAVDKKISLILTKLPKLINETSVGLIIEVIIANKCKYIKVNKVS